MNKLTITLLSAFILSACSSPPEPIAFPHKKVNQNVNDFVFEKIDDVQKNRFDRPNWYFSIINQGSELSQANFAKFWYLAQHATKITLHGNIQDIETLKLNLKANGATANIILNPNQCISTRKKTCSKLVQIEFEKERNRPETIRDKKGDEL